MWNRATQAIDTNQLNGRYWSLERPLHWVVGAGGRGGATLRSDDKYHEAFRRSFKISEQNASKMRSMSFGLMPAPKSLTDKLARCVSGVSRRNVRSMQNPHARRGVAARALAIGALTYKSVVSILKNNLDRAPPAAESSTMIDYQNLRGPGYFH